MILVKKSQDVSEEEYEAFRDMVRKGTEIFPRTYPELSERARYLVFAYSDDGNLIATGGVKVPRADQRDKVFEKVRSSYDPRRFDSEVGWFQIEEEFKDRGIEKEVLKEILDHVGKKSVFSLLRADNVEMVALLKEFKFRKTGTEIPSTRGDYFFVLYVRE